MLKDMKPTKSMSSDDPIRNIMTLVDENRGSLSEGTYLELCDNIKRLYALGGETQKVYLLNLTNDYLQALEKVETLQQELVNMKRELLRSRVSRFENVSRPIREQRGLLENLLGSLEPATIQYEAVPLPPRN
jgi:hypothetical protein